jgi:DNA repair protein RecO (recombination protein O)
VVFDMLEIEQTAYLLHSRPYRENQLLLDLLTQNDGKVGAITYVSHGIKSNKKSLLQPFTPLNIVLKGSTNLKKLSRVEPAGKSLSLVGNHLYSAFYLNELMVRLLPEQINCISLFEQYHICLQDLMAKSPIELILRNFESILLDELGISLDFSVIFEQDAAHYYYLVEQGFVPVIDKPSGVTFQQKHLQAIAQHQYDNDEVRYSYKKLMRHIINQLLGNKPLNSRKLFK